jgi:hypothetical protein
MRQLETNQVLKQFIEEMKRRRYQPKRGLHIYFNSLNLKNHVSILAYALASN